MVDLQDLLGARLDDKDERSRAFRAPMSETIRTVRHRHYGPKLAQWLSSCTGHAPAQALNCKPHHTPRAKYKNDDDAMRFYHFATVFDQFPWVHPPTDKGSSVLGAAKGLKHLGEIDAYGWMLGYDEFLAGLMFKPVVVGTIWLPGMFNTNSKGFLDVSGRPGNLGHSYVVVGYNARDDYHTMLQSWPLPWGYRGAGFARISGPGMRRLIEDDGEAVVYT